VIVVGFVIDIDKESNSRVMLSIECQQFWKKNAGVMHQLQTLALICRLSKIKHKVETSNIRRFGPVRTRSP